MEDALRRRVAELERLVARQEREILDARAGVIVVGDLRIAQFDRAVFLDGRPLPLLPREYSLLVFLARSAGSTVTHEELRRDGVEGTNVVAVHISRLRAKLTGGRMAIATDRGRGYRLEVAGSGPSAPVSSA